MQWVYGWLSVNHIDKNVLLVFRFVSFRSDFQLQWNLNHQFMYNGNIGNGLSIFPLAEV